MFVIQCNLRYLSRNVSRGSVETRLRCCGLFIYCFTSNLLLGSFYKHINNRLSCRTGVGALRSDDGTVITTDTSKAELLNDYFSSTCTRDNGVLPAFDPTMWSSAMSLLHLIT